MKPNIFIIWIAFCKSLLFCDNIYFEHFSFKLCIIVLLLHVSKSGFYFVSCFCDKDHLIYNAPFVNGKYLCYQTNHNEKVLTSFSCLIIYLQKYSILDCAATLPVAEQRTLLMQRKANKCIHATNDFVGNLS